MRKNRFIGQDRCYHLISRLAHRAFFLDDEEKDRAVALMRRVEAGVKASMSYCINRTVSISSDPFDLYTGKFDDRICTEIHAYATMNKGTGLGPKGKEEVISGAVNSVLKGCEISKAKPDSVDSNFAVELEKRVSEMYDQCRNWEAK